jgi:hypothetical protein
VPSGSEIPSLSPGEGCSGTGAALSHLSRLLSRRTAIHTTTGTSRLINKIMATADSNRASTRDLPAQCLGRHLCPQPNEDCGAAVSPGKRDSAERTSDRSIVFMAVNVTMPDIPDMPDIASAG